MFETCGILLRTLAMCIIACSGFATSTSNTTLLIEAVQNDDRRAVAELVPQGADVNTQQPDGTTPLAWAAVRCNADIARLLLDAGANPDVTNAIGIGPLALATQNHSAVMVELLLDRGADPNTARESGETPLMTAARSGQIDVIKLLLDHGADIDVPEKHFGQTALMWAAGTPDAVRLLVDHGADVQAITRTWDVTYTIYAPTTFTLGKTGIPWNTSGEYVSKQGGQNALFFAVQNRNLDSARLLVDAGVDVNSVAADGTTPLLASLYKWVSSDRVFVLGFFDPARMGSSQKFGADPAMARLLLDRGAAATGRDGAGYTPLHGATLAVAWAEKRGSRQEARRPAALLSLGRTENEVLGFNLDEALDIVRRLLNAGADPNAQTMYPTPGPAGDVRINPAPPGSSAFHIAASSNSVELVRMIADWGGDPNLVRNDGHTPFSTAVVGGNLSVVKELIASGADLSARYNPDDKFSDPVEAITLSRQNQTIMHIAAATLMPEIVEHLYSQGAPLNLKNSSGETPLDLADHQERFREALERQDADGDPNRVRAVVRPTQATDVIKKLLRMDARQAPVERPAELK